MKSSQIMMNSSWKDGIQSTHDWWIVSRRWKNTVYDEHYLHKIDLLDLFLLEHFLFVVDIHGHLQQQNGKKYIFFLSIWTWSFQIFKCHQLIGYTRVFYCFQKCWKCICFFIFCTIKPFCCVLRSGCLQEMRVIDKYLSSVLRIQQAFNKASLSLQQIIIISGNKSYNFWQL